MDLRTYLRVYPVRHGWESKGSGEFNDNSGFWFERGEWMVVSFTE